MSEKKLIVYTDGACQPNPGKGGWAFIVVEEKYDYYVSGGKKWATNNEMEIRAVLEIFKEFPSQKDFVIYTDSNLVFHQAQKLWKRKDPDLRKMWEEYDKLTAGKNVKWVKVKARSGDEYNDKVDKLAKSEIDRLDLKEWS